MKFRSFGIVITVFILLISLKIFNDNRERDFDDLIGYKHRDFHSMGFITDIGKVPDDRAYEWLTEEKEVVEELLEFLSQYRIKRISEAQFNEKINSKDRFEFTINHSKANPSIVWVFGDRVHILVGHYYEVLNGPIDMEWINEFNDKYREENMD